MHKEPSEIIRIELYRQTRKCEIDGQPDDIQTVWCDCWLHNGGSVALSLPDDHNAVYKHPQAALEAARKRLDWFIDFFSGRIHPATQNASLLAKMQTKAAWLDEQLKCNLARISYTEARIVYDGEDDLAD